MRRTSIVYQQLNDVRKDILIVTLVCPPGATQSNAANILCFCSSAFSAACPSCFLALTLMSLVVLVRNLLLSNPPL